MTILMNRCRTAPLNNVFEHMLGEPFFGFAPATRSAEGTLPVDISEDEKSVIVRASLPGIARENIEAEVHEGVLTIRANVAEQTQETGEHFYRRERRVGSVSRRLTLPAAVTEAQADAELRDGVLTLRFPKTEEAQPRKVKIK